VIKGLKLTEKKLSVEEMNTEDLEQLVSLVRAFRGEVQAVPNPSVTVQDFPVLLKNGDENTPTNQALVSMIADAIQGKGKDAPSITESLANVVAKEAAEKLDESITNVNNNDESSSSEMEPPNFNPEPKKELKESYGSLAVPISERFKGKANFPTTPGQVEKFLGKQIISPRLAKAKQKYDEAPVPITPATPAPKKEEEPEFWKTGIKETNGVKRYKLHYKCPTCSKNGRKYVTADPEKGTYPTTTNCESCFSKLRVRPALDKKVFSLDNRDGFGNYLVAVEAIHDTKKKTRAVKN